MRKLCVLVLVAVLWAGVAWANPGAKPGFYEKAITFLAGAIKLNREHIDITIDKLKKLKQINNKTDEEKALQNIIYPGYLFQALHLETILHETYNYIANADVKSIEDNKKYIHVMTNFIGHIAYQRCEMIVDMNKDLVKIKSLEVMLSLAKEYQDVFLPVKNIYDKVFSTYSAADGEDDLWNRLRLMNKMADDLMQ